MSLKQIFLLPEQMQRLVLYEITFDEAFEETPFEDTDITIEEVVPFTLDCLFQALKNIQADNPTCREFGEHWYFPMSQLYMAFQLEHVFDPDYPRAKPAFPSLLITEEQYSIHVWNKLETAAFLSPDENMKICQFLDLKSMIKDFQRFLDNLGKPLELKEFSAQEMVEYISRFEEEEYLETASPKEKELAKIFIERLCKEDNATALRIKGYACYGGNDLYPCDWQASHDCLMRLLNKTGIPDYANTLGYIYYYGRINNGIPEYDKAFQCFFHGSVNGIYESMYKLGDMFLHGYACQQSPVSARSLYQMVYFDSRDAFLRENNVSFADAALRMGNVYSQGIATMQDLPAAYGFYLEASYAAKLRASESLFFGNASVVASTQRALQETKEALPANFFQDYEETREPWVLAKLAENNNRCKLSVHAHDNGWFELIGERLPTQSVPSPEPVLITIPSISFTKKGIRFSEYVDPSTDICLCSEEPFVHYDYCAFNLLENRYEFYYDNQVVAWIRSSKYRIYPNPTMEPYGDSYCIVSISLSPSGRTFDYLSEIENIQPGDTVYVETDDAPEMATVVAVSYKHASELPLPLERYKKVLGKA